MLEGCGMKLPGLPTLHPAYSIFINVILTFLLGEISYVKVN